MKKYDPFSVNQCCLVCFPDICIRLNQIFATKVLGGYLKPLLRFWRPNVAYMELAYLGGGGAYVGGGYAN
jgi:hypothetical protein